MAGPLYPCLRVSPPVDHVRVITTTFIIFGMYCRHGQRQLFLTGGQCGAEARA